MVDLEVVGRHALLFDDDAQAKFVNSPEALVQWSSLLIDRYDVRHLLSDHDVSLPKKRRPLHSLPEPDGVSRSDLDHERFQDLPLDAGTDTDTHRNSPSEEMLASGNYQAVGFSYGNINTPSERKSSNPGVGCSGFRPPFPVPEMLLNNLPPTEKVHQIIARTAKFVCEHGGQSEIVLRVKQGDNPTFGFLMPDHHLHVYFRFLVDHQELLKAKTDVKNGEEQKANGEKEQAHTVGGALSLLGSVYGSGEEEDGTHVAASESKKETDISFDVGNVTSSHDIDQAESLRDSSEVAAKCLSTATVDEKVSSSKRASSKITLSSHTTHGKKRETETSHGVSLFVSEDEPRISANEGVSVMEDLVLDPPLFMKRAIDKTAEFIQRNGKEFEAVLIEQDKPHGKFPFLLPSNQYHPFYLKVLHRAHEPKLPGKSISGHLTGKERMQDMGGLKSDGNVEFRALTSHAANTPSELKGYESERKEKFRMVIGGSKKDTQDSRSKSVQRQCGMSAEEAAAVVLAATRGRKTQDCHFKSIQQQNGMSAEEAATVVLAATRGRTNTQDSHSKSVHQQSGMSAGEAAGVVLAATRGHKNTEADTVGEGTYTSSTNSFSFSCRAHSSASKPISNGAGLLKSVEMPESQSEKGCKSSDVSVAKAIAKTVAIVAASEADSSEASLTREQKQKAERLKRAKMFAAMIKGGAPRASESLANLLESNDKRAGSLPPPSAAASNLSAFELHDLASREREGSSVPADVRLSDEAERKSLCDDDEDTDGEQHSRKRRSTRSGRHEDDSDREYKRSRKKHEDDSDREYKRSRKRHEVDPDTEYKHSRKKHEDDTETEYKHSRKHEDESNREYKHSRKKHRSKHSSRHSRDDRKHRTRRSSHKDREDRHRHKNRHQSSSEDEHRQSRSDKLRMCNADSELEEGELSEMAVDHLDSNGDEGKFVTVANDSREGSVPSGTDNRSSDATEVPDDLRAKVRAMLLATL